MTTRQTGLTLIALFSLALPGCPSSKPAEQAPTGQTKSARPKSQVQADGAKMPPRTPKTRAGSKTTMPYLLGTPSPFARALMKRVFKMSPSGADTIEIVDMGAAGNQKVKTQPYVCLEGANCGYNNFKLIVTPKDNRVIGGMTSFAGTTPHETLALNAGKTFRLMSGHKHIDEANAWLATQFKGTPSAAKTFGHAHLTISKDVKANRWKVLVRLP